MSSDDIPAVPSTGLFEISRNVVAIDNDGNVIREGMAVISGGDRWVVGYASRQLVRLDRRLVDGRKESRLIGQKRLCCIHILGWREPGIYNFSNAQGQAPADATPNTVK